MKTRAAHAVWRRMLAVFSFCFVNFSEKESGVSWFGFNNCLENLFVQSELEDRRPAGSDALRIFISSSGSMLDVKRTLCPSKIIFTIELRTP